jgi:preprotein translocase subunit SecD
MKQLNRIFFIIILFHSMMFSTSYSGEDVLDFRLVHPDNDKLINVSASETQVDNKRYELFKKENKDYWVDRKSELNNSDFKEAIIQELIMDSSNNIKWVTIESKSSISSDAGCRILLYLSKDGQKKMESLTENNSCRRLAIIYNNQLLMAPVIQGKITDNYITIDGLTYDEAYSLKSAILKKK